MKRFTILAAAAALLFSSANAQIAKSGKEAANGYGYSWLTSDSVGGKAPVFNWVDIKNKPGVVEVSDLGDDDVSAGQKNIGFDFRYFYSDYNKIVIGSNGYISFNPKCALAPAFNAIPTQKGQGDNFIAAFLSDITFGGRANGNKARCFYWTNPAKDSFVVTYDNVAYFVMGNEQMPYRDSLKFQIILCKKDSSVVLNYLDINGTFNQGTGNTDLLIGMENVNGAVGLLVAAEVLPKDSFTIKMFYPATTAYQAKDAAPNWFMNIDNAGIFGIKNQPITVSANVTNLGNTDLTNVKLVSKLRKGATTTSSITASFKDTTFTSIGTNKDISAVLKTTTGGNLTVAAAGNYFLEGITSLTGESNTTNNNRKFKLVVVDTASKDVVLDYNAGVLGGADGQFGLTGVNTGAAVLYYPPFYPATISRLEFKATNGTDVQGDVLPGGFYYVIRSADASGNRGGVLATDTVPEEETTNLDYTIATLATPLTIGADGFYVEFYGIGDSVDLMTLSTTNFFPPSFRSYEIIENSLSPSRNGETTEFTERVVINGSKFVGVNTQKSLGFNLLQNYPNPTNNATNLRFNLSKNANNVYFNVTDLLGKTVGVYKLGAKTTGDHAIEISTENMEAGIYYYTINVDGAKATRKMIVQK